jgi:hypothetical protein
MAFDVSLLQHSRGRRSDAPRHRSVPTGSLPEPGSDPAHLVSVAALVRREQPFLDAATRKIVPSAARAARPIPDLPAADQHVPSWSARDYLVAGGMLLVAGSVVGGMALHGGIGDTVATAAAGPATERASASTDTSTRTVAPAPVPPAREYLPSRPDHPARHDPPTGRYLLVRDGVAAPGPAPTAAPVHIAGSGSPTGEATGGTVGSVARPAVPSAVRIVSTSAPTPVTVRDRVLTDPRRGGGSPSPVLVVRAAVGGPAQTGTDAPRGDLGPGTAVLAGMRVGSTTRDLAPSPALEPATPATPAAPPARTVSPSPAATMTGPARTDASALDRPTTATTTPARSPESVRSGPDDVLRPRSNPDPVAGTQRVGGSEADAGTGPQPPRAVPVSTSGPAPVVATAVAARPPVADPRGSAAPTSVRTGAVPPEAVTVPASQAEPAPARPDRNPASTRAPVAASPALTSSVRTPGGPEPAPAPDGMPPTGPPETGVEQVPQPRAEGPDAPAVPDPDPAAVVADPVLTGSPALR